ncbi:hypothetical protein FRB97_005124 [Tulasnella sp. 331]|nr:hypothetical protein FRB97_005124 [Tulasnella sp. 331]
MFDSASDITALALSRSGGEGSMSKDAWMIDEPVATNGIGNSKRSGNLDVSRGISAVTYESTPSAQMVAEYSVQIDNKSDTDFKLFHYGVGGAKAKTHQHPSPMLNAGATEYLSWNTGNDRMTPSAGHAYWVANDRNVFAFHMNGYDNGQYPFTAYQYSPPVGTVDGPNSWIRSGGGWGDTYSFCFTGEGGKKYKATMANDPQDGPLYTTKFTITNYNDFW